MLKKGKVRKKKKGKRRGKEGGVRQGRDSLLEWANPDGL